MPDQTATEPEDAGHGEVPPDLLELHEVLEFQGQRPFTEAPDGPGPEQALALSQQDVQPGGAQ